MIGSISLAIYLLIGLFYAHHQYNELIDEFEEEIDENDPEEKEYIEARNNLYDQMHNVHKILGEKGLKTVMYLFFMIFWLPVVIYWKFISPRH